MNQKRHIVLIGMPGAGKSTVGKRLASRLGYRYVDTDDLIEAGEGRRLEEIIRRHGMAGFCRIEARYAAAVPFGPHPLVVATGGSVVYSAAAMGQLKSAATVVFLSLAVPELRSRLGDLQSRGVVVGPAQDLDGLWAERHPLYLKYADLVIVCDGLSATQAVDALVARLGEMGSADLRETEPPARR